MSRHEDDALGLAPYATGLADFIRHCETPLTVAIQGDWGTGKTSLMYMVQNALTANARADEAIETVWFQTWQHAQFGATEALSVSLLSTLLRSLAGDPSLFKQGMALLARVGKPVANAGLRLATFGATELGDFESRSDPGWLDFAESAEKLREQINVIVRARLAKGAADRLVIFVDDLDRVPPARAVEILETIKLFVDIKGCVFVLALDYAVVRRGLAIKFGVDEKDLGGRSFFDKIIQLPFSIPTARYETDRYIGKLFSRMRLKMGEDDADLFSNLARKSVSVNPRGIKRVFNSLQLLLGMAGVGKVTHDLAADRRMVRTLFALLCLQNRFEPVYEWLALHAHRLDANMLTALEGVVAADNSETRFGFESTIEAMDSERRHQFAEFASLFLEALQDPESDDERIDANEVMALQQALTLTNVTAVNDNTSAAQSTNKDFRLRNMLLMRNLQSTLERNIDVERHPLNLYRPHGESFAMLKVRVRKHARCILFLHHGEDSVQIGVRAAPRTLKELLPRLHHIADQQGRPLQQPEDKVALFWSEELASLHEWSQREELLNSRAIPKFISLYEALREAP